METTTATTMTIKQTGEREFAIVMPSGLIRCYVIGTREQAQAEADRIQRGIDADARWMNR